MRDRPRVPDPGESGSDGPSAVAAVGGGHGEGADDVLLVVEHDTNRALFAEAFGDEYRCHRRRESESSSRDIDLVVADRPGLERFGDALAERKEAAAPAFLPCLLLTRDDGRLPAAVWDRVDGVVRLPTSRRHFGARVEGLLRTRRLSVVARRQNERLERFGALLSHDLRNPLNVAAGRIDLARAERESEHLETASAALDRMDALVEDVLTMTRQEGPVEDRKRVRLSDTVERCWQMVDTGAATLVLDGDAAFAAAPGRLRRLFENLLCNAVEHGSTSSRSETDDSAEHGGEGVTVRVGALADGFYVADDGPGIPPERREEVFDAGHTTAADGTGFGLSIVEQVTDAHGWSVRVTASREGGARFEVGDVETAE